jgi:hypothetical protein
MEDTMSDLTQSSEARAAVDATLGKSTAKAESPAPSHENEYIRAMQAAKVREGEIARERATLLGSKS